MSDPATLKPCHEEWVQVSSSLILWFQQNNMAVLSIKILFSSFQWFNLGRLLLVNQPSLVHINILAERTHLENKQYISGQNGSNPGRFSHRKTTRRNASTQNRLKGEKTTHVTVQKMHCSRCVRSAKILIWTNDGWLTSNSRPKLNHWNDEKRILMDNTTTYYFVGIKGSGMSSLALILHDKGFKQQDQTLHSTRLRNVALNRLRSRFIHSTKRISTLVGLMVIAGNSFTDDPEIKKAREMGLPVYRYHEFLGKLIEGYTSIGVAGAHGKTSTTGLLSHVLSGIAPTSYLIGDGTGKGYTKCAVLRLWSWWVPSSFLSH